MKNSKSFATIIAIILISILLFAGCSTSKKFVKLEQADVDSFVEAQNFVFVAQQMLPLRGTQQNLTGYYDVSIKKDTMNAFLPYFGRAYGGVFNPASSPLQFTSTNFRYAFSKAKNGSWDIVVSPADNTDVQSLNFNVFGNGNASLNVISTNRDAISFYGYVQPLVHMQPGRRK